MADLLQDADRARQGQGGQQPGVAPHDLAGQFTPGGRIQALVDEGLGGQGFAAAGFQQQARAGPALPGEPGFGSRGIRRSQAPRTVGSRCSGSSTHSSSRVPAAGSSSVFSKALADVTFIASAG